MLEGELFISSVQVLWEHVHGDPYLRQIPALASLGTCPLQFTSNVTFLVGENGSGKSTLIEAMAVAYGLNPEGGTRNYTFSTHDSHSALYEGVFMRRGRLQPWTTFFLRAESFYNVATEAEACSLFPGAVRREIPQPSDGAQGVSA